MTIKHRAIQVILAIGILAGGLSVGAKPAMAANESGPVTIERVGIDLVVTGTSGNDTLYLRKTPITGRIEINQPIDGAPFVRFYPNVFGKIIVKGRGGNDALVLTTGRKIANTIEFSGGNGSDQLLVNYGSTASLGGNLIFRGDGGEDTFQTSGVLNVDGALTVVGGAGPLRVDTRDLTIGGKFRVVGNSAVDYVAVDSSTVGGLFDVKTFDGDDRVFVDEVTAPRRLIDTGLHADRVSITRSHGGVTDIRTGAGNDVASLQQTSGTVTKVTMGNGADKFDLYGHNSTSDRFELFTGDGRDTISFADGYWNNVVLNAGGGNDTIELDNPQINGTSTIVAGAGNDTTVIDGGRYADTHVWRGGTGNDVIDVDFAAYRSTAKYDGQGGADTISWVGYSSPVPTFVSIDLV